MKQPNTLTESPSANDRQVAGDHYRTHGRLDLQHWDMVVVSGLNYFQAQITRYVFRWRDKNGIEDLEKSLHYLDKAIEIASSGYSASGPGDNKLSIYDIVEIFKLDFFQGRIAELVMSWRRDTGDKDLIEASAILRKYIELEKEKLSEAKGDNVGVSVGQEHRTSSRVLNPPAGTR